jgi:AraC-like DNA-binding protein
MSDENFGVAELSKEVYMSRTHLHHKLRALINQSPSEFIRTVRLNRAAQLLRQHSGNVTEIAYSVGFTNPSYFTRCFKNQFDQLPSHYSSSSSSTKRFRH